MPLPFSRFRRKDDVDPRGGLEVRQVFHEHGRYVARSLRCLGVPAADVEDLLQEVFVVVHRRLPEFEGRGSIKGWLYAITLRVAKAHRRRLARRREKPTDEPPEMVSLPTQEAHAAHGRERSMAVEVLDALPEKHREVFLLYEVEELSMVEVAECAGIPLKTAYSRLYAARKQILSAVRRVENRRAG